MGAYNPDIHHRRGGSRTAPTVWQRNYYEHIIRDGGGYARIIEYMSNNPKTWENDKFWRK